MPLVGISLGSAKPVVKGMQKTLKRENVKPPLVPAEHFWTLIPKPADLAAQSAKNVRLTPTNARFVLLDSIYSLPHALSVKKAV